MRASEEPSPRLAGDRRPALLPVGSLEGHGPDLPLGTDLELAERLAAAAADRTGALLLPAVAFGDSREHASRPGTALVSPAALRAYVQGVASSLAGRRLLVVNAHGGNRAALEGLSGAEAVHAWRLVDRGLVARLRESEEGGCCHAGEFEASLACFLLGTEAGGTVFEPAPPEWDTFRECPRPRGGPPFGRSRSGVLGDPRTASFAKGEAWFSSMADALCERVGPGELVEEGTILAGPELEPVEGSVVVREGRIASVEEGPLPRDRRRRVIVPALVDAHVHLADAAFPDAGGDLPLEGLVSPPDGLKHRLLAQAPTAELEDAYRRAAWGLVRGGIGLACDFREGGLEGVRLAHRASSRAPLDMVVLGRAGEGGGADEVVAEADGLGASSPRALTEDAAEACHRAGKPVAVHVLEAPVPEQLERALALGADVLVHLAHATEADAERAAAAGAAAVVCPRSNLSLAGRLPPARALLDAGLSLGVGTDNAFVSSFDLFREMELLSRGCGLSDREALRAATVGGGEVLGRDVAIAKGNRASFIVLEHDSVSRRTRDVVRCVVRRLGPQHVLRRYLGGRVTGEAWFAR